MTPEERRQADFERDRLLAVNVPLPSERRRLAIQSPQLDSAIRQAERERIAVKIEAKDMSDLPACCVDIVNKIVAEIREA